MFLKKSTAVTIRMGPALDKTDGVTEETGLSPTVEISKNGAAFVSRNSTGAITHDSNGWYAVSMSSCDNNTVGKLIAKFDDSATHLPVWHEFYVLAAGPYDSLFATGSSGLDTNQRVNIGKWIGTAPNALIAGRVDSSMGAIATGVITADSIATDAFGAVELSADAVNEIADGCLSRGVSNVEATATARSLAGAVSKLVNKVDISGATLTVRKTDDATVYFTQAITTNANQDPITAVDTA